MTKITTFTKKFWFGRRRIRHYYINAAKIQPNRTTRHPTERPTKRIVIQFIVEREKMYNTFVCLFLTTYEVKLNTLFSFEPKNHCTLFHIIIHCSHWVVAFAAFALLRVTNLRWKKDKLFPFLVTSYITK